jgi:hypothetical protein
MRYAIACFALLGAACGSSGEPIESTSTEVAAVPGISIQVAAQNEFYTQPLSCGARAASVVSLGGAAFLQVDDRAGITLDDFLAHSEDDVACRLGQFLANHPGPNSGGGSEGFDSVASPELCGGQCPTQCRVSSETRTIVMDIEKPHLAELHTFGTSWTSPLRKKVVNGFKTRVRAARAVFPSAKLGLYGTLVPDGRGRADDPVYVANRDALQKAARYQGLLDGVDYLVPILYVRFGCNDESANQCPACDASWETLSAMTKLGIQGARYIDRTIPILPLLGFGVNNGKSCFHRKLHLDLGVEDPFSATLGKQIGILRASAFLAEGGPIEEIVLWAGSNTPELPGADPNDPTTPWQNPNGWSAKDFTDHLCSP